MTDEYITLTILDRGADSYLLLEASSRQKEGSGSERYVSESNNFDDVVAPELVLLREEVLDFSMTESSNRVPWYFLNLTILRPHSGRMLALYGETKSVD